jgi:hypothetical protein
MLSTLLFYACAAIFTFLGSNALRYMWRFAETFRELQNIWMFSSRRSSRV